MAIGGRTPWFVIHNGIEVRVLSSCTRPALQLALRRAADGLLCNRGWLGLRASLSYSILEYPVDSPRQQQHIRTSTYRRPPATAFDPLHPTVREIRAADNEQQETTAIVAHQIQP